MLIQTLTPTERTVTVDIPESFLNHPVEIMVVPVPFESIEQRRKEIEKFFAKHQVSTTDLKFNREELYDR
ncbi:MAG: hypothetical protein Q7S71_00320 [Candidatus Nitrotoga sp.]|nr:hypothetical protein [Candidatus Nitrotoga sp.]